MNLNVIANFQKCLLLIAMLAFAAISAFSYDFECDGIQYSIIDREARTCRTVRSSSIEEDFSAPPNRVISFVDNLVIPPVVSDGSNEYTVTEIGHHSFSGYWIDTLTIPETVTKIGTSAFAYCGALTSASLPESLVEIGDSAFCQSEISEWTGSHYVRIPDGVRKIGKAAFLCVIKNKTHLTPLNIPAALEEIGDFCFCRNATRDLEWPKVSALRKIGRYAFYDTDIEDVPIPNSVYSIGEYAFSLSDLEHVSLPSSLTEMGSGVFEGCYNLKSVDIPEGATVIGKSAFKQYERDPYVPLNDILLPSTIKNIGDSAFYRCYNLEAVNLPDGLEKLGKYAFAECGLRAVVIPESIDSINERVFRGNEFLVSAHIPNSVRHIGYAAFSGCGLKELQLPAELRSIGPSAFAGGEFTSVHIPENVVDIGSYVFSRCTRLKEVVLPDNMSVIKDGLFNDCESLCSISTISSQQTTAGDIMIPHGITDIGADAFNGCSAIRSVKIPATVKRMTSGNPFPDCKNLEEFIIDTQNTAYKVVDMAILTAGGDTLVAFPAAKGGHYDIPASVTTIASNAFFKNQELESITFPEGLMHIESGAFANCRKYHDPVLPLTIKSIDKYAFNCIPFKNLVLPPALRIVKDSFGVREMLYSENNDVDEPEIESVRIYGYFDNVSYPIGVWPKVGSIYYITKHPQGNNGRFSEDDEIKWGFFDEKKTILYVLEEVYDEIRNDDYWPWSRFEDIRIYDPTDDPYYASVQQVDDDIDPNLPLSVFTLSGMRVADSTEGLPSGIYIIRQGAKAKKITVI